jgi:uncharacterized membrane protein
MRSAAVHPHTWTFVLLGFAIMGSTLLLSQFLSWTAIVILFCAAAAAATVVARPQWGAYALAFFAPMSGLVIDFSRDQSLSRLPYVSSINAPLVDLFAIFLLVVIGFLFLMRPDTVHLKAISKYWQLLILFFIVVGVSALLSDPLFFGTTLKAFFRPYLFMWLGFAVPILLLLKTRAELFRALFVYECAALLGALMGAVSLVTQNVIGFVRATPFSINGYAPFGVNHNVLAESLTAIIPFAWWFADKQPRGSCRTWLFVAAGFISAIALLTFSRAAWIVMTVQLVAFLWWRGGQVLNRKELVNSIFAAVVALVIFFLVIQTTSIADSSDNTRKDLLGIAITYWQRAPWFGQGPGMYVPLVSETVAFRMDYGAAMDAHGWVQKLMLETGLVGTLALALFLGFVARGLWIRRTNEFHFLMLITLVSLWGYQLFNTGYFDGKVWGLMGIILASIYEKK